MSLRLQLFVVLGALLATFWQGGCAARPEPTFPVQGLVTMDGKPLDGGTLLFEMIKPGKSGRRYTARGSIAADGRYHLSTFSVGDGAPAGRYRTAAFARQSKLVEHGASPSRPPIPLSYGSTETSGLEFEVKPGSNTINIELASAGKGS